jgi:hypothetical protein
MTGPVEVALGVVAPQGGDFVVVVGGLDAFDEASGRGVGGALQALLEQGPVGQVGEGVVQGEVVQATHGGLGLLAGMGVDEVGGGDVSQRLGHHHVGVAERADLVAVEVQGTRALLAVAQGKVNTASRPAAAACGAKAGNCSSAARSGISTAVLVRCAATHGP